MKLSLSALFITSISAAIIQKRAKTPPLVMMCQAGQGPVASLTMLDIFYGSSEKAFDDKINESFDALDKNKDGLLDDGEINIIVKALIPTALAGVNITERNVLRLTDVNGDHVVNRTEYTQRNKQFMAKVFHSCSGLCNAVSSKLESCKQKMKQEQYKRGNLMMTLCHMGKQKLFQNFGHCIQKVNCEYIDDCFDGVKANTHCTGGETTCKAHKGYYAEHSNFATSLKKAWKVDNGSTALSIKEHDITGTLRLEQDLGYLAMIAFPMAILTSIIVDILVSWPAVAAAFGVESIALPLGVSRLQFHSANMGWVTFKLSILSALVLSAVLFSDNYLGVTGLNPTDDDSD